MLATEKANEHVRGTRDALTAALNEHIKTVDVSREQLLTMTTQPNFALYDNVLHSKTSLEPVLDPDDDTRTQWIPVPIDLNRGVHFYPKEGALTLVYLGYCLRYTPGRYEDPQFSGDVSQTGQQFVFANDTASSSQINERIGTIGREPQFCGTWSNRTSIVRAEAVVVPGLHPYSRLFVRFVNRGARNGDAPQNVLNWGGDAPFKVHQVLHYPQIIL